MFVATNRAVENNGEAFDRAGSSVDYRIEGVWNVAWRDSHGELSALAFAFPRAVDAELGAKALNDRFPMLDGMSCDDVVNHLIRIGEDHQSLCKVMGEALMW